MTRNPHCFLALLLAALMVAPSSAAVISDSFTPGDGTGTVGGSLNGQMTEVGGATWQGRNSWEYTASGTLFPDAFGASGGANTRILSVPLSVAAGQSISMAADVIPPSTSNPQDWSAIGFSKDSTTASFDNGFFTPAVGQLWMALRKNGNYFVIAGSGTVLVADIGVVPGYNSTGFNRLELMLDTATNVANAKINGVSVLTNYDLDTLGFTPDFNEAGFHFHRPDFTAGDNFVLTILPDPDPVVPEPASAVLVCLAAFAGFAAPRPKRS